MVVLTVTTDGKKVVTQEGSEYNVAIGGENKAITVRCDELKRVEALLNVQFGMQPSVRDASPAIGVKVEDNVIGMTVSVADGTTLTPSVMAMGT